MFKHLSIRNLAIVKSLDIDIQSGMTAITGETGAGKSIAIDALGLCLGERADANMVRKGQAKAEVTSTFDVSGLTAAKTWLVENDLDDQDECIIRRVISAEGRSKAYINGSPVPLQQLKLLAQFLVSIHGQNAHQQLLKKEVQRRLLDGYANHPALIQKVEEDFQLLADMQARYKNLQASQQQRADRKQLLTYQVEELDDFALQEDEFCRLEVEHKKLSNSQTLLEEAQISFHQLYEADEFNALSAVQSSLERISQLQAHDSTLSPIVGLLNEASINIEEAAQELRNYTEQLEIDPLKMQQVEARYSMAMELARKHQIRPEEIYQFHQELSIELNALQSDDSQLASLQQDIEAQQQRYLDSADSLSQSRIKSAKKLSAAVESQIHTMNMTKAKFFIDVTQAAIPTPTRHGIDEIGLLISTNPGQEPDLLDKVVSGGELSRIGLAIQVIGSATNQIPTMIFDEVDTGISGPTASVVGQLLRKLGQSTQVICVTHLPQVAASGHNQMFVTKFTDDKTTETHMISLQKSERIDELARLLAGDTLTDSAIANAKELLNSYE